MAKTTKASKKKAPSKAPAKKAAKAAKAAANKKVAKPAGKPAAKPAANKAIKKPIAKPAKAAAPTQAAKTPAAKPSRKVATAASKPVKKAATKSPAKSTPAKATPASKPAPQAKTAKPVKAGIAEGSVPLVTLTPAEPQEDQPRAARPEKGAQKRGSGGSLRYVNDAESDQTRGSVDELDSLDVIEADEDEEGAAEFDAGEAAAEARGTDEAPDGEGDDTAEANAMADRDTIAAGPEGDEPLLTTEERAARKIEHTPETTRAFAIQVARALADDKCTDLVVLDVRNLSSLSDYIVVGSGTSDRQMHFAIKNVVEMAGKEGHQVARTSSDDRRTWLIADFVDVIIHLFEPNTRAHYDIEMLWGDAPRLEWERPDQVSRDRAGLGSN